MSFWDLSDGKTAADTPKEYEVPGGNMEPIPNNSDVLAIIDEIKWTDNGNESDPREYISARWSVMAPEQFKNRKVFHKLWVTDFDPNAKDDDKAKVKRDKARRMLAAIDANAGGSLTRSGDAPTDDTLAMHLMNKPMVIKCMEYGFKGNDGSWVSGNWISAVSPSDKELHIGEASKPKPQVQTGGGGRADLDDEIPF
jgi:hypothetical protein